MFNGCKEIAINSHILQTEKILRPISVDNHLIQIKKANIYYRDIIKIESIGINDAFSFYGFCNTHDNDIFKYIEKNENINFSK